MKIKRVIEIPEEIIVEMEKFPHRAIKIVKNRDCAIADAILNSKPYEEPRDNFNLGYVKGLEDAPKGEWYDFITNRLLKARHGDYVLYKVDFLLDNLAREVNIMESARRMKGGAE